MVKYLYTSDLRISTLPNNIKDVANKVLTDISILGKSEANNAATLVDYFNLFKGTETCKDAANNPRTAIRNYILKFQFPNTRTPESMNDALDERMLFAPYRVIVNLLVYMAKLSFDGKSYLTKNEILFHLFCNSTIYSNPQVDYNELMLRINDFRGITFDYEAEIDKQLKWKQYDRQAREFLTVLTYSSDCFRFKNNELSIDIKSDCYREDEDFISTILNYNRIWVPSNKENYQLSQQEYISYMDTSNTPYNVVEFEVKKSNPSTKKKSPFQVIYFGAPGTGKSHSINGIVDKENCVRTTFHPDSDYSTFVGAYKPTKKRVKMRDVTGKVIVENNEPVTEEKISYDFVPQAFTKAYIAAWTYPDVPYYLVIEEINRGNCAQIFGDLFQLLDRKNGVSEYPIKADNDLCTYLEDNLPEGCEGIANGELKLPSNLYIFATMNTSDQSLFPIDSAFKRRWDWKYIPIRNGNEGWKIAAGGYEYDWWSFLEKINPVIGTATESEDKKLGYFFAKADDKSISADKFVSKVIFYLYNDVFKDNDVEGDLLANSDTNKQLIFEDFFNYDGSAKESKVVMFLDKLGVVKADGNEDEADEQFEDDKTADGKSDGLDHSRYSINGEGNYTKAALAREILCRYSKLNPSKSVNEIVKDWQALGYVKSYFIHTEQEFNELTIKDKSNRISPIPLDNGTVYLHRGWSVKTINIFIDKINATNWDFKIDKIS